MEYIIVQAGGKGTRLQYLTANKPKALLPVENSPMIFHLFKKYPDKRFIIIADYQKDILRNYLKAFAKVKYLVVNAEGEGTCAGISQALKLVPSGQPFMLVWSDLILPKSFTLPEEYNSGKNVSKDYIGISETFTCRWKYESDEFKEETSREHGVAGFFLFAEKERLKRIPQSGELVRWMQQENMKFDTIGLAGTREFGLLEEYEKLVAEKCRPFNRISVEGNILTKEPTDPQGEQLAVRERAWYQKAAKLGISIFPHIYQYEPLKMDLVRGKNIYECDLNPDEKSQVLEKVVFSLKQLHESETIPPDLFSMKEAYFNKTMKRLAVIEDLVPYAREKWIKVNGRMCRNIFYQQRLVEKKLEELPCGSFHFIHGDCTFSNLMVDINGQPILIDPRGYFGNTELFGDSRYDWAKLYYSIVGNYDQFNLKRFKLKIGSKEDGIQLSIASNHWEDMEERFFALTGANRQEIRLLHAIIWLSFTTYAWQDFDSICGAFYNGLYYLEEVL